MNRNMVPIPWLVFPERRRALSSAGRHTVFTLASRRGTRGLCGDGKRRRQERTGSIKCRRCRERVTIRRAVSSCTCG